MSRITATVLLVALAETQTSFGVPRPPGGWWLEGFKPALGSVLWSVRDAAPAAGRFPIVIYAPSFGSWPWENADLCEYIASYGYVVIASPGMGTRDGVAEHDVETIDAQARDILFLIDYARSLSNADMAQIGAIGFSWGGLSNLFAAARDDRIKVLVALDGSDRYDDPSIAAMTHFVRGRLAAETGDPARAAMEMESFGAAFADPAVSSNYPGYNCWIAPAEEAAGHPDKADALLKTAGTFVDCYRFRADIFDGRGDWPGAQKAYADAVALAPDLPATYYSWGVALARHGDLAGAEAKLKDANRRGPHWAIGSKRGAMCS